MKKDFWLELLDRTMGAETNWYTPETTPRRIYTPLQTIKIDTWESKSPVLTFKTLNNVSRRTSYVREVKPVTTLPYWGEINKLKKQLHLYE